MACGYWLSSVCRQFADPKLQHIQHIQHNKIAFPRRCLKIAESGKYRRVSLVLHFPAFPSLASVFVRHALFVVLTAQYRRFQRFPTFLLSVTLEHCYYVLIYFQGNYNNHNFLPEIRSILRSDSSHTMVIKYLWSKWAMPCR